MVLDIMEIKYFYFYFVQNFYLFHLQLLVIVVPTKLSIMSGLKKVHVQVTGVACSFIHAVLQDCT